MHSHGCYTGVKLIILGAVVLANELFFNYSWWLVLGALLVLKGLFVLTMKDKCCPEHKKK